MNVRGRKLLADGLAVLACVLLPLAMLSSWVAAVATDTDRYVATVGPLATDPEVVDAVEQKLSRLALKAIDLPRRPGALGSLVEEPVRRAVKAAVAKIVESPQFEHAWREANRSAHRQLVAVLRDGDASALDDRGRVSIQMATVLNSVLHVVSDQLPVNIDTLPEVQASFAIIDGSDLARVRQGYRMLDVTGSWLPIVCFVVLLAALTVGASRRRVIGISGYGALLAVSLLAVALRLARMGVADAVPTSDAGLALAVWDQVFASLWTSVRIVTAVALVALVVRWLTGRGKPA